MNTTEAEVDQTTYTQQQIPGVDWSKYATREIPTTEEIVASLSGNEYYEHLAQTLFIQFDVKVSAGQLKVADVMAQQSLAYDRMRQASADA